MALNSLFGMPLLAGLWGKELTGSVATPINKYGGEKFLGYSCASLQLRALHEYFSM